jgi:hypothetical protein
MATFNPEELGQYEVAGGPGKCYYIPEFLTEGEEEYLMRKVRFDFLIIDLNDDEQRRAPGERITPAEMEEPIQPPVRSLAQPT